MLSLSGWYLITAMLTCASFIHEKSLASASNSSGTTVGTSVERLNKPTAANENGRSDVIRNGTPLMAEIDSSSSGFRIPDLLTDINSWPTNEQLTLTISDLYDVTGMTSPMDVTAISESESMFYDESIIDYPMYVHGMDIMSYGLPVLLAVTVIDNTMAVIVLQHPTFRGSATGFILSALAVADTLVIFTGLLRLWVYFRFDIDFRNLSELSCKFHLVFTYFSHQLSAWTLILLTAERFVAVRFPFQCKRLITLRRAVIAWCSIVVVLFGADCHFFGTAGFVTMANQSVCYIEPEFDEFFHYHWYWIDALIGDFFPFLVIFIGNIAILMIIAVGIRRRNALLSVTTGCSGGPEVAMKATSMTVTLIVVSVVFLVLNIPADVYFIGFARTNPSTIDDTARMVLFYGIANLLLYCSNSINFLMYFISGRKFREATMDVICCRCFRKAVYDKRTGPATTVDLPIRRASTLTTASTDVSSVSMTPRPSLASQISDSLGSRQTSEEIAPPRMSLSPEVVPSSMHE